MQNLVYNKIRFWGFFCLFWFTLSIETKAQTEPIYFTYPNNPLALNPAYAGSWGVAGVNLLVRKQSLVLQNASSSQYLSYQTPLANNKAALGFQAYNSNLIYNTNGGQGFVLSGAFRHHLNEEHAVAIGANGGLSQVTDNVTFRQIYKPNYGLGIYYNSTKQYIGVSIPNIAKNEIVFAGGSQSYFPRNSFVTAGKVFEVNENTDIKVGIVVNHELNNKTTKFDANAGVWFKKFVGVSLWYNQSGSEFNNKKAVVISAECQATTKFRFGLSYDPAARNLNSQFNPQTGRRSFLAMYNLLIKYDFDNLTGKINNFRFF